MNDKNTSPVGWYIGSYLLRFVEVEKDDNNDPNKRFLTWENTLLLQADSIEEAFQKLTEKAKLETEPYLGGEKKIKVQWLFEGITELLPIYEELEDGSEVMWRKRNPTQLKNLKKLVFPVEYFRE